MKIKKQKISKRVQKHSSFGEFTKGNAKTKPRLLSGGHGQENIKELKRLKTPYNILEVCENGVRLGNVPSHKSSVKRHGTGQAWFPKKWTRKTIKRAGEKVLGNDNGSLYNGIIFGSYKKVNVGVYKTNGKPSSVFPSYNQTKSAKRRKK